ncbi:hypothetical protein QCA50_019538 [Cerrena zonata]|uniref:Hcy-binding domain-containing protein n=1 Tax=Cerrena zonata TaxID=2478898 RepID=A0AAW0FJX9_9APHY
MFHQNKHVLVLDGGFGTTLEDLFDKDISTSLWSAKLIDDDPETIINAHLAFLRAGADIILTSTYQCAFNTFTNVGYTHEEAVRLMRKAVHLAVEAKTRYFAERKAAFPEDIKIALSLGPYGATLSPAQEFDGYYPPPFGPRGFDPENEKQGTNAFGNGDGERKLEESAVEALKEFHLERLRVFKEDEEVWGAIDFIAFETVPVTREIKAIRRAMGILQVEGGIESKPWWISTVWPDGKYPEKRCGEDAVKPEEVIQAVAGQSPDSLLPVPDGFGINCTAVDYIASLVDELGKEFDSLLGKRPWLALYPNGGDVYDPKTKTWIPRESKESWAESFGAIVRQVTKSRKWAGVIAGGCCRTKPIDIRLLNRIVKHSIGKSVK